jgi:hypothetical protein
MKLFVALSLALGSVTLLGCADDKPAPKPASTAAATTPAAAAKPAPAPSAAKPAGGW